MSKTQYALAANPERSSAVLLDYVKATMQLKNDAALARYLKLAPPVISKLRAGRLPFGASHIIHLHELTEWPIAQIKAMLPLATLPATPLAD